MSINTITTEDLRRMEGKDGLILQGCGGDAQEWVDGINEMFTEAGILKDGSKFKDVSTFQYGEEGLLLYPFEDVKLEIGKLAMWRLQTHETFGGTWLADFVPNRLGGFIGEPAPMEFKTTITGLSTILSNRASTINGRNRTGKQQIFGFRPINIK